MKEILLHPKDRLGNRSDPALAYLLKFDPGTAEAVLQRDPALLVGRLDSIAKETAPSAFLTAAALRQFANPDTAGTANALTYLRHFGDEHVREPIYKAFLLWYERNEHLSVTDVSDLSQDRDAQIRLGNDFVSALLGNQGWVPDAELKSDVRQRTIGPEMRASVDRVSDGNSDVTVFPGDYASYEIGPFDSPNSKLFEEKLDQFPKGTTFTLQHVSCPDQPTSILRTGWRPVFPECFSNMA